MNDTQFDITKKEHILERIEAMDAEGNSTIQWLAIDGWTYLSKNDHPTWDSLFRYRRAPAPKMRPWNCPNDVPPLCWLRDVGSTASWLVVSVGVGGVVSPQNSRWDWAAIYQRLEYSTDRINWHKCEVPA